jgi:hypothetical protein
MPVNPARCAIRALVVVTGLATTPAFAADPDAIAKALVAAFNGTNSTSRVAAFEASYAAASASGDDVTISDFRVTVLSATVTVPRVVVTGAATREKGGFTARSMSFDGGTISSSVFTAKWDAADIENPSILSPEEIGQRGFQLEGKTKIEKIKITPAGLDVPVVDIDALTTTNLETNGTINSSGSISGIKIRQVLFNGTPFAATLSALGYQSDFAIDVAGDANLDLTTNATTLRSFTIDIAGVGKLSMDGNYTLPVRNNSAAMDQASLGSLHVRFDNTGIVERVLDMQARRAGIDRGKFVDQVSGALPLALSSLQNKAFENKVFAALKTFLGDPRSISISASPKEPVRLDAIKAAAESAPQTIPDLLGADITAND